MNTASEKSHDLGQPKASLRTWLIRGFILLAYALVFFLFEPEAGYEPHVWFHTSVACGVGYCLIRAALELREIRRVGKPSTEFWSQVVRVGFWIGFLVYAAGDLLEGVHPSIAWLNDYKYFPETLVGSYVVSILIKEGNAHKPQAQKQQSAKD